ncbi:hypothetical protein H257_19465 [Aphanomyces astaci]|uniref:HTH psq-type domain-containing protein n=1 Tax=Aphanomyces astaci TaxID=112090 RepID=W4F9X5_APHAT|nr:hypothetical protein H257_19465 [Aphanomyces astaci]ETV63606.1 hypothetical protein H257_19465 [Aphanomyces astaci]|eukprot:XP_009846910.1 hypothetical protein H257_19465 [Aphanomyces astaci]
MPSTMPCPKRSYTIATKLKVLGLLESSTDKQVADLLSIPRRTIRSWVSQNVTSLHNVTTATRSERKSNPVDGVKHFPTAMVSLKSLVLATKACFDCSKAFFTATALRDNDVLGQVRDEFALQLPAVE